ncbi:hypothetical protein L1049_028329 [Liquidambar formosana]|uniref:Uncharacterized protein n=1 Tax=Liquidambar formosana TaxID=63359 RepID=A0AAP0WTA7_LIQFO
MGRPPCCDKIGVKKGPWTPEEDIILASYIQEYGPGNWRAVPTNTGLLRCSKSCRLRWTNYLRPGIRRGVTYNDLLFISLYFFMVLSKWMEVTLTPLLYHTIIVGGCVSEPAINMLRGVDKLADYTTKDDV